MFSETVLRDIVLLAIGFLLGGFFPNPARWAAQKAAALWKRYVK